MSDKKSTSIMYPTAYTTWFTVLLGIAASPQVVDSQPLVQIRKGQFFSRFKCPNIGNQVACASDNPTKSYNFSSREQCCLSCHSSAWSWFNFIDNEDQTKSAGGECQLFDHKPVTAVPKTRCSLYKSDSILLNPADISSICTVPVVIMNRPNTISSWYQDWNSYKFGFTLADSGYWLGLEQVHQMTSSASYRLRVEFLCSGAAVWTSVQYQSFVVGDETSQYILSINGYVGSVADQLSDTHNGMKFSTSDRNNDIRNPANGPPCSPTYGGGWWFAGCWTCCLTCTSPSCGCGPTAARMSILLN